MIVFAFSHRRAQRLIDERLDEERGERRLDAGDAAWLEEHLRSCTECRAVEADRRELLAATLALKSVLAPEGFAARVLAAKTRGAEPAAEEKLTTPSYAIGSAIAAAVLATVVAVGALTDSTQSPGNLGVSGTATMEQAALPPHFVVRAMGLGPAKARARAVSIVKAHGGRYQAQGSAIVARVPRDELVGILRDLAKQGTYKVARADAGELDPSLTEVVVKFEIE